MAGPGFGQGMAKPARIRVGMPVNDYDLPFHHDPPDWLSNGAQASGPPRLGQSAKGNGSCSLLNVSNNSISYT